mmetsp:Transcript_29429/g.44552  ORF Transcript_29429/g.44552 Transcript_29429/m.44552 type:complete len:115 (-) Transcript_29429:600-944(-)|eukprot:CAMPEP_0170508558 /NCGR_PEP_ID=MMETSP0208-20121228/62736_1 /TAXON_ID=197538 /ORGANISM="Strombidium inclinatum, Strain S3" /LENGTH=114 /DNA_ID=CAMNT_0010791525 /DNA_START=1562 /DNA_END=1906 /DNA_ORIENTATION=-
MQVVERQRSKSKVMGKSKSQVDGMSPSKFSHSSISPVKVGDDFEEPMSLSKRKQEKGAATEVIRKSPSQVEVKMSPSAVADDEDNASESSMHEIDMITSFKQREEKLQQELTAK